MREEQHRFLSLLGQVPARLTVEQSAWVLTLKSSSGFLWTDYDLLLAAGLPPDELHSEAQLRAMLTEQSRWIGAIE